MTFAEAAGTLRKFWVTLTEFSGRVRLEHVFSQLPDEVQKLFTAPDKTSALAANAR
jgi:hypothetical protein